MTARGDGGESRGRAEPPDDEQVDGAVDCLQNQRAEDGEHKEAELTQNAAVRSISLTVRVTPPRGICQAFLTDAAYELSVKSAAKRLRIFPLPMAVVVLSCLLGAVVSAKFANRCEIARLNRIVGIVLVLLGIVTIAVKLL